jgi:hypothetical protein
MTAPTVATTGGNHMYFEFYYWGPKAEVEALTKSLPLLQSAPGGKLMELREFSWWDYMTKVAANPQRVKSFGAANMKLEAVLSRKPKGKGPQGLAGASGVRGFIVSTSPGLLLELCASWHSSC